ncbi:cyclase family protein [Saccharophagus degradans]|uniref:cyclase family protein n=1 Tax=Saccharophagus degradans TaxID=86304 RepID=UPI00247811E6|nr:cyclase family protein [Saccharophagus degradans]WGO99758.1 cyclase family protein [Saccharophagus degradans]
MNRKLNIFRTSILGLMLLPGLTFGADVASSPWGSDDEIGRLNLITPESRRAALQNLNPAVTYDLSVEYFIGMPSWQAAGDPQFQMWMTHTPKGTKVDDPLFVGDRQNDRVSYSGSAFSMYAHTGTHIDALNHFGLNGKIWNHFSAAQHLGDRGWQKTGAENIPPIIARGVLLDVPAAKQVDELSPGYRITREDLEKTLVAQDTEIFPGDVVLIRTGRMRHYTDAQRFMENAPGLGMAAARFLAEDKQVLSLGADNLSFEAFPSEDANNYVPVHTYLLAQQGVTIMELVHLEQLARDRVYHFAFIGTPLKLRGADAAPLRPIAIPYADAE